MLQQLLDILTLDTYKLTAFVLEYIVIFAAICADLFAGIRKARKEGKLRTSYGFRKSLDKILQYYGVSFFLSFIDILQMHLVSGITSQTSINLFSFPMITFISTIYICLIEYKSIREKRDEKENARIDEVTRLLSEVIKDNKNNEVAETLIDTLKKIKNVNQ